MLLLLVFCGSVSHAMTIVACRYLFAMEVFLLNRSVDVIYYLLMYFRCYVIICM